MLREHLTAAELELLRQLGRDRPVEDFDWDFGRVVLDAKKLEAQVERHRARIADRHHNLVESPRGRQITFLNSSPPMMLVALAHDLVQRSAASRFESPRRSLELAELGLDAARAIAERGLQAPELSHDLAAEAWGAVGNARRLNGDYPGAAEAFAEAEEHLALGTGDRLIRAEHLRLLANLRFAQGEVEEAVALLDRQINLRKLTGDRRGLGVALVDRGIFGAWIEPLEEASRYLSQGLELVDDTRMMLLAAFAVAEHQARAGDGLGAYRSLCTAKSGMLLARDESFARVHRWILGITHRVLGRPELAEADLTAVRQAFLDEENVARAAVASLDLTAVYAAQGRHREARELLEEAYAAFTAERMERPALAALGYLRQAAQAERLTESLTVELTNFIVRSRVNRKLEFEPPGRREPVSRPG